MEDLDAALRERLEGEAYRRDLSAARLVTEIVETWLIDHARGRR